MVEVGKQYTFSSEGHDSECKHIDGHKCVVLRPLTEEEADIADVGPMWRIRLDNGLEMSAFDDELFGDLMRKKILVSPGDAALALFNRLGEEISENGDRMTKYVRLAGDEKEGRFVSVAVIEEKVGLPEKTWGYGIHVINDVDGTYCDYIQTDGLGVESLLTAFTRLFVDLACGRM